MDKNFPDIYKFQKGHFLAELMDHFIARTEEASDVTLQDGLELVQSFIVDDVGIYKRYELGDPRDVLCMHQFASKKPCTIF